MSDKVAPAQRVPSVTMKALTELAFEARTQYVELTTSRLLDLLYDLNDLRADYGLDATRAERFENHLEAMRAEFQAAENSSAWSQVDERAKPGQAAEPGTSYGREVLLDVVEATPDKFTRENIKAYLEHLCSVLRLERADLHFWDYDDQADRDAAPPHLKGVSAVQFVTTSSIVLHTLDESRQILVNLFACGEVDAAVVERATIRFFGGRIASMHSIERGRSARRKNQNEERSDQTTKQEP